MGRVCGKMLCVHGMLKYAYIASGVTTRFAIKYTSGVALEVNFCKGLLFICRVIYLFIYLFIYLWFV